MKTWSFIDKSKWPVRGEWDSEPDKAQWQDEETGLACLAVRARAHWCGYVGVPVEHPLFGKGYDSIDVDVHGGLTFASECQEGEGDARVCHVPEPGQPDRVWWLGFDCAHSGDLVPATNPTTHRINLEYPMPRDYEHYRTLEYVRQQCAALAQQVAHAR